MKIKDKIYVRISIVAIVIVFLLVTIMLYENNLRKNNRELLRFYEVINLNASLCDVIEMYVAGNYKNFTIQYVFGDSVVTSEDTTLLVKTPLAIGARNWLLLIDIHLGSVDSVRIRSEDSLEIRPKGAPVDKFNLGL